MMRGGPALVVMGSGKSQAVANRHVVPTHDMDDHSPPEVNADE